MIAKSKCAWILIVSIGITFVYYYNFNCVNSPSPAYKIIEMDDRQPVFKLVTFDGKKPYADGDRAQAKVVEHLKLMENCRRNSSLIVVDVGAYLGDFGLYAAACGCSVYLFEVQPVMVGFIYASILINKFSSKVHVINKAVSDLPSGSELTFVEQAGSTTVQNGSLRVSTIRLDDFQWPEKSIIFLLKIDVEGFELNVLRSAKKLFQTNRIQHLIFEYTAWWTDRSEQKELLKYVENLKPNDMYVLDRLKSFIYGPLDRNMLDSFHENHLKRHLQTDIYANFIDFDKDKPLQLYPYDPRLSYA